MTGTNVAPSAYDRPTTGVPEDRPIEREQYDNKRSGSEGAAQDPRYAEIRPGNEEALKVVGVGPMSYTFGAGGLGTGKGLGGIRDSISSELGGSTGAMPGGNGVEGTKLGSTGGDASGPGATNGGDTA